jgi:hypothetical protein
MVQQEFASQHPSIATWLEKLSPSIPLFAVSNQKLDQEIQVLLDNASHPIDSVPAAMIWLRVGLIDRPHRIVQEDSSAMGSYIHGIVHRLEGDYWNSNYWFQRVRDNSLLSRIGQSVESDWQGRQSEVTGTGGAMEISRLWKGGKFHPSQFVSLCEAAAKNRESAIVELLSWVSYAEWRSIWASL